MVESMYVRERKFWGVRRAIEEERGCKPLLRFQGRSVDFLAAECLIGEDSRGGVICRRQEMEIFLRFVGDPGFQSEAFTIT